jgi:MoaA/NifB/PqqE/SkfB family radical SAM enzyme
MVMDCGAFDGSLTIHPDGKVSPCCIFDKNLFKDLSNLNWLDPWQDLRDGKGCNACKHSGPKYKDSFNKFKNNKFSVRHLDVRNNNLCNLECSICNSYYSSKWAHRLHENKFVSTDFNIDLIDVEHVYFAGGEPLINKKHWEILDSIPDPKRVSLQYNSNLVDIQKISDYWPRFKNVHVNASMDAVGELGEYLRYGTQWDKWEKNLHYAAKYATVNINPTISILNIFHLREIEQWSKYPVVYNILTGPDYLCVNALPAELKKQISYIPDNAHLTHLLSQDKSFLFPHTMSFILLQDNMKGTNIWKYQPFQSYAIKEYIKNE